MAKMRAIIPNGEIHTPYGATEALPVSSISATEVLEQTAARTQKGEGTCVGRPLPNVLMRIVEPTDGPIATIEQVVELPSGSIGEIIVQGASVTRGYDYLPEADADSKILDDVGHWHRMGDMGWLDDSGRLWFCGRKVERVMTDVGAMYTDCCEAIFNTLPWVYRSALIDLCQAPAAKFHPLSRLARLSLSWLRQGLTQQEPPARLSEMQIKRREEPLRRLRNKLMLSADRTLRLEVSESSG